MYYRPKVTYHDNNDEERKNSVVRYMGTRVLTGNKNFLCALTGQTGAGKSWSGLAICELYSKMFNIPFDPNIHVISSLKEILQLINAPDVDKKIQFGSILMFDEPQVEANARDWQSDMNRALNQLISTFRNQRLIVLFATPYLEFIDKQSRILFHGEFKILGYNRHSGITRIKPRFLDYSPVLKDFYKKRLIVSYKPADKSAMVEEKLSFWHINKPSKEVTDVYEAKKLKFSKDLNKKLLDQIELQEKQADGKNKADDFIRICELYEIYRDDLLSISKEMPHIPPMSLEKMIYMARKTRRAKGYEDFVTKIPKKRS